MKQHHKVAAVIASGIVGVGAISVPAASATERPAAAQHAAGIQAAHAMEKVISRGRLAVYKRPTTKSGIAGWLKSGQIISIRCWDEGGRVHGNRRWYRIAKPSGWVSAYYIRATRGRPARHC
ncbi:SH3 domain-containing protein [Actinomadura sp. NEAU-AAG7]|uniref:SH3 domain-containing protein n=1 Tax=Actinomadura sp. NEAU-AAG7 TaxID=2839640 RepID=UPI001BE492C2|nr:SH3 domain-containing protein [Actinomadura sp. NEAU-AAG7]MBT2213219.1 SH3 domain-containing protein [Actinomadura sp. NEAU-AAG7]